MTRLLEGSVVEQDDSTDLRQQLETERLEASNARREARTAKAERDAAVASMTELRRQLNPLYRALQMVFGELEAVPDSGPAPAQHQAAPVTNDRTAAVWEAWKTRLGAGPARVIEALLLHGELGVAQLKVACGMATSTVSNNIVKMRAAGLINKNSDGKYSLKSL